MPAATVDLEVELGATLELGVQWPKDAPNDLSTGWTVRLEFRHSVTDEDPLLDAGSYVVLSAGSAEGDNIHAVVPPSALSVLEPSRQYSWFLHLTRTADAYSKYILAGAARTVQRYGP